MRLGLCRRGVLNHREASREEEDGKEVPLGFAEPGEFPLDPVPNPWEEQATG